MYGMNGMGGWFMGGMWLFWILLLALVALAVGWGASILGQRNSRTRVTDGGHTSESAEDVLKKRYARGEISHDEFEVKLQDLRGHDAPHPTPSRP
jgi:putative membrane protein